MELFDFMGFFCVFVSQGNFWVYGLLELGLVSVFMGLFLGFIYSLVSVFMGLFLGLLGLCSCDGFEFVVAGFGL